MTVLDVQRVTERMQQTEGALPKVCVWGGGWTCDMDM